MGFAPNPLDLIRERFGLNGEMRSPIRLPISRHRELLELWRDQGYTTGAEIGTEEGRYAEQICRAIPNVKLFCVDPYQAYDRYADHVEQSRLDHFYRVAKHRLTEQNKFNVEIIRATSLAAVRRFRPGSLDFVFIDGNHHFDFVVQDIIAWAPIVRKGGIVAGHDYKPEGQEETPIPFGVIQAVNAYTDAHKIAPWFVTKRDRCPSWMWVNA
jgi:predicted O-methyltransferase YrrM